MQTFTCIYIISSYRTFFQANTISRLYMSQTGIKGQSTISLNGISVHLILFILDYVHIFFIKEADM